MTLIEFLEARIADREAAAYAALGAEACPPCIVTYRWSQITRHPNGGETLFSLPGAPTPALVLAECKAKRAMIDILAPIAADLWPSTALAKHLLAVMALPYVGHKDYDPEWEG